MKIAQRLYEGIELGEQGATGLITYMRTDSPRVSDDALDVVRGHIDERYGKEYLPDTRELLSLGQVGAGCPRGDSPDRAGARSGVARALSRQG